MHIDKCPVDRDTMPWLWMHNKPVLDELRTIVEPLADRLSSYIEADIADRDGVTHEAQAIRIQHEVPFGVPYTLLPPRLFSGLYDGSEAPRLPEDDAQARQLIVSYSKRRFDPPITGMPEGAYTFTHEDRLGHILDDIHWMADRGVVIDPVRWERYRQVGREQAENGRYDLDIISVSRGNSIKSLYHYPALAQLAHMHATGSFDHFMMMPTSALDLDGHSYGLLPVGYLFMPEGAYGARFSEKLLRMTCYIVQAAQQALGDEAQHLAQNHPELVAKHLTRGRDGRSADASLITTVQEGGRSVMEVIALLTADKVPGYDDPDRLFEAIVLQGIVEEFTRAIPMGMLGPLVFAGKYFPKLLLNQGEGKLGLNPVAMHEIKQAKKAMAQQDVAEWALFWSASEEDRKSMQPPLATSLICPAAMPHGALNIMNHTLLKAYQAFRF